MRVRTNQTQADRRRVVVDLLGFIKDFNQLDTTLLIEKANNDFTFVEAAEAVLQMGVGPWAAVDALRNFCVQALTGLPPKTSKFIDQVRPQQCGRVSPFSVPFELLRAVAPQDRPFDATELRTFSTAEDCHLTGGTSGVQEGGFQIPNGEIWLATTVWARSITTAPINYDVKIEIFDTAQDEMLHFGLLHALLHEAMPCFWKILPASRIRTTVHGYIHEPASIILAFEGWKYFT